MTLAPLRPYQVTGIKQMLNAKRFMLCDEPGVAKTRQLLEAANRTGYDDRPVLIVVGLRVALGVWADQIEQWMPEDCGYLIYSGQPHQRKKLIDRIKKDRPKFIICSGGMFPEIYKHFSWGTVIFDEYHKMGLCNRKSKMYKSADTLLNGINRAPYVFFATGTPILKAPDDLYPPLSILYPKEFTSYWRFVDQHCTVRTDWQGYKHMELKPKDVTLLKQQLSGRYLRRKLVNVLPEIKEPIRTYVPITMDADTKDRYKTLAEELMLLLGDQLVITPNDIAKLVRLRQLLVSPQTLFSGEDIPIGQMIPTALELAAEEWAAGKPVIIFTPFRSGVEIIEREVLKYFNGRKESCETYTIMGGNSGAASISVAQEFQRSEHPRRCLIGTIKSAASYTVTCSDIIIFAGTEYSAVDMDQAERRILRFGQTGLARFFYLYHRGSLETKIIRVAKEKGYWADVVLTFKDVIGLD